MEYHFPVEGSGGQLTVIRILGATPGVWNIQLHGDILLNGSYQVWLPMTGFVAPSVEFLAATPDYTVTSPGSAVGVICCGAYDSASKSLYAKSSRGPAWDGRILPDLTAPGVGVGGIYPYGPGSMSGTSAAAAVLAGTCGCVRPAAPVGRPGGERSGHGDLPDTGIPHPGMPAPPGYGLPQQPVGLRVRAADAELPPDAGAVISTLSC